MNKNIIIILVGGFLVAVLVALLVQSSLGKSKKEETSEIMKSVLVAAQTIPVGKEIGAGDLKWQKWPENMIFPGAILQDGEQLPEEAISGKALRQLNEGEPVHMSAVVSEDGGFLSAKVSKGMRAVGIEVNKYVVADRLIIPGDIVDIIVTYRVRVDTRRNPQAQSLVNRYASETILGNVKILAIDDKSSSVREEEEDSKSKKKKASKKVVVTLEVTPEGAEQLMLAYEMGDISFAARSIGDDIGLTKDRVTTDVQMSRVLTDLANMSPASSQTVRIYNGDQMEDFSPRGLKTQENGVEFSMEENPNAGVDFSSDLNAVPFLPPIQEE